MLPRKQLPDDLVSFFLARQTWEEATVAGGSEEAEVGTVGDLEMEAARGR